MPYYNQLSLLWFDVTLQSDVRKVPQETSVSAQPYVMTLPSGIWGTFKQWKQLGHPVCKGQKSTGIAFFKPITKETVRPDGRTEEESYMVIRSYSVFAAEQVTGYPIEVPDATGENHWNQQAEDYFRRTGAKVQPRLDRA